MTFSIVVSCEKTGQVGVAAMTAMVGIGKLVAHEGVGTGSHRCGDLGSGRVQDRAPKQTPVV